MYIAVRPLAGQAAHYRPDVAFTGLLAILFVCASALRAAVSTEKCGAPDSLMAAVILWSGIFVWGAIRSPNLGASIPLATDAILYALILLAGYFLGRLEPAFRGIFVRAIIAIVVVEAFAAIWQVYVDMPRFRQQVAGGEVVLPDSFNSKIAIDRLNGDDAYVTFENPNSLAGFLLVGFFLLLGHAFDSARARFAELFCVAARSKGRASEITSGECAPS